MVGKLYRVIISRLARQRLKDISEYLTEKESADTAQKVRSGLLKAAKDLEKTPEIQPLLSLSLPGIEDKDPPYRYARKWSYKIIFRIFEPKDEVRVLDFFHSKQRQEKLKDLE